jgi:putative tricarboxylic transport membrane protein
VITIPKHVLLPIIAFLTVVGAYAVNNSVVDVYWMIAFGIIGYFMKKYDFPTGPMVLGIILGPMLESNFRRGIIAEEGLPQFLLSLVTHPLSLVLTLAVALTILTQTSFYRNWKNKRSLRKKIG